MNQSDEFYVGYLPMPPALRRFIAVALALIVLASAGVAIAVAVAQRSPGHGQWFDQVRTFTGRLTARPYPMLMVRDGSKVQVMLLVSEGKFGAAEQAEKFAGRQTTVHGLLLRRGAIQLIELADGDGAIEATADEAGETDQDAAMNDEGGEAVNLSGEIIDPKCYAGAMKPGEGKTHKACAALCLSGGIPPMFLTESSPGRFECLLLTDEAGNALAGDALQGVIDVVGEPVMLTGHRARIGSLAVLRVSPGGIHR